MQLLPVARYSPMVRMGNWYEEICLEQDKINKFKMKRDSGNLLVEKTRLLFDNFHREITLEAPKDYVRYGTVIQLMPVSMKICEDPNIKHHPALSIIINERAIHKSQYICEECELTVAPAIRPNVRNSFRVVSIDGKNKDGDIVYYKQKFGLQTVDAGAEPLFLYSGPKCMNLNLMVKTTFDSEKLGETNNPLGLISRGNCGAGTSVPLGYCNWMCDHIDPSFRFECQSFQVPTNSVLVIIHSATNKNLAAENCVIQTLFGPEYLTSVTSYKSIFGRETWKNQWIISNGSQFVAGSTQ